MRRLTAAVLAALFAACGGEGPAGDALEDDATAVRVEGRVTALGEPLAGAFVLARTGDGALLGRATTGADGRYALSAKALPAQLVVKALGRAPRPLDAAAMVKRSVTRVAADVEVGPPLGADGTTESLTFLVASGAAAPRLVPQLAFGLGGGLGPPYDEVSDLAAGPRSLGLWSLLPAGSRPAPDAEAAVQRKHAAQGDYLEVRFNEKLGTANLGAAYEALLIEQIVATASLNESAEALPVKILVRCASCAAGWAPLPDGHVGPSERGGSYPLHTAEPGKAFPDLAGHRYARHVGVARAQGLLADLPAAAAFRPDAAVTRAEVAALLVRALGLPLSAPATPSYKDVPRSAWSYRAVETARSRGLMLGGADGAFRPDAPVTRAELAAYALNGARWPLAAPARPTFTDVPASYWAFARVETAHGFCRTVEARDPWKGTFSPALPATRAEAAAAAVRLATCLVGNEVR